MSQADAASRRVGASGSHAGYSPEYSFSARVESEHVIQARRGTRLRVSEDCAPSAYRGGFLADHDHENLVSGATARPSDSVFPVSVHRVFAVDPLSWLLFRDAQRRTIQARRASEECALLAFPDRFLADHDHDCLVPGTAPASGFKPLNAAGAGRGLTL
jgi:hypothetical protein